jgi:hypothetical protein
MSGIVPRGGLDMFNRLEKVTMEVAAQGARNSLKIKVASWLSRSGAIGS